MRLLCHLKYLKTNQLWKFSALIVPLKDVSPYQRKFVKKLYNDSNYESHENNFNILSKKFRRTLYCGSLLFAIKGFFENESIKLDDDPLKDLVKQAWLYTKRKNYQKAINILHEALALAYQQKNDLIMTRIYLEMADITFLSNDNAEDLYKLVLQRLISIHNISNSHPSYITTSIKLASVLAEKGNINDADIGFKHCITKQKDNVLNSEKHFTDEKKNEILNAKALYGYALNAYAHFLVKYGGDKLISEAQMYFENAVNQSNEIFGENSMPTLHLINNFAALCIMNNYFEIAKKYLEKTIKCIEGKLKIKDIIIGMYCNYAEALYHTGNVEEAKIFAKKAVSLSKNCDKEVIMFAASYADSLIKTIKRENSKEKRWFFF